MLDFSIRSAMLSPYTYLGSAAGVFVLLSDVLPASRYIDYQLYLVLNGMAMIIILDPFGVQSHA